MARPGSGVDVLDRLGDRLAAGARRAFADALVAAGSRSPESDARWSEWGNRLGRSIAYAMLLGRASVVRRTNVKRAAVPSPTATFAAATIDEMFGAPHLEALQVFARVIPGLPAVLPEVLRVAHAQARAVEARQKTSAWEELVEKVTAAIRAGRASQASSEEKPEGFLAALRAGQPEAVARAVASAAGAEGIEARTNTEYRTALITGFNAGGYQQMQAITAERPIWRLREIRDRRTRGNPDGLYPNHGKHWQMDGFAAPHDDPVWDRIWPPNGWNCRATVEAVPRSEAVRLGWMGDDGTVHREALRRKFAPQLKIIGDGEYPDPGWTGNAAKGTGLLE